MAKRADATVLATAGTDEKCERALELGADHVLNNRTSDVAGWARGVTNGAGVNMVFDHVGTALQSNLEARGVRRAKPLLCSSVQDGHTIVTRGEVIGEGAGPVWGTIIDDEEPVVMRSHRGGD